MDCADIPEAIASNRQQQLVFVTGLDIANNQTHSTVFAYFTQNRGVDRPPLRIQMLTADHAIYSNKPRYPKVAKSSRGYIKVSWMQKYLNDIPAVIVLFADLNWNHPSWNEKVTECESKISSLRASIGSRGTRICVVLLQEGGSLAGDDAVAVERACRLCQTCQLPQKQLFVFPFTDQLHGYVVRLEAAFHDLALGFYQQCIKCVRAKSIPNNSSNLIIRQQFKLAFLSGLRQDTHTALRHYKLAYQHCTESEVIDSEIYELRMVAGLLNYKICQLSFLHSTALEAISQQRKHISLFFSIFPGVYPSPQLAAIEFSLWKSKQCAMFAGLFEHAVSKGGLAAVSTQHPGIHLLAAADNYRTANEQIAALVAARVLDAQQQGIAPPYPEPDPLAEPVLPHFFGQRPWRVSVEGGGLADERTEVNARIALEMRCAENHAYCIGLLSSAIAQYKKYKCARMQRHAMLLMTDEYTALAQHSKALQMLSHVLWECRIEKFTLPVAVLLTRSLLAAYCLADVKEFMCTVVQMLNVQTFPCFRTLSTSLADGFEHVRRGLPPGLPFSTIFATEAQQSLHYTYEEQWSRVLAERAFFSASAPHMEAFVHARAAFLSTDASVYAGSPLLLMASLRSCAEVKMRFDRLRVCVEDVATTTAVLRNSSERTPLFEFTVDDVLLIPNKETTFFFTVQLKPSHFIEAKQIVVYGLSLEIGTARSAVCGTFDWDASALAMGPTSCVYRSSLLDASLGLTSVTVKPREARFRLEGDISGEALLGEVALLTVNLVSMEATVLPSINLEWRAEGNADGGRSSIEFLTSDNKLVACGSCSLPLDTSGGSALPQRVSLQIQYCCRAVGSLNIALSIAIAVDEVYARSCFLIPVHSQAPFNIRTSILTFNTDIVKSPLLETDYIVNSYVEPITELVVAEMFWKSDADVVLTDNTDAWKDIKHGKGSKCVKGGLLGMRAGLRICSSANTSNVPLGHLCVRWKRESSLLWVQSQLSLGSVQPRRAPLTVKARVGISRCVVRAPIPVYFTLRSLHRDVIDLQVTLDMADLFMFAGNKQVEIRLLEGDCYEFAVSVMALTSGRLPFPHLQLRSTAFESALLDEISFVSLPSSIFVQPLAKGHAPQMAESSPEPQMVATFSESQMSVSCAEPVLSVPSVAS